MKITCNREQLAAAFQTAASVAPSRSPKPILQNVKIVAATDGTTLMATDMEVGVRVHASGVEVEIPGEVVLPVGRMGAILRECTDSRLSIALTSAFECVVSGERSRFKMPVANASEFPEVAKFDATRYCMVHAGAFREAIRRTVFAADVNSSRYALGGVLIDLSNGTLITAVATDGRRLAKAELQALAITGERATSDARVTIIPARACQLIERSLADLDATDEVLLSMRANDVLVKTKRATIYSRLIEGKFHRWRDVIPSYPSSAKIELPVSALASAVRQAAVVASDESRGIDFVFSSGKVILKASTPGHGEATVEVPIAYEGHDRTVALDYRFVADFLKAIDMKAGKPFTLEVDGSSSATVARTDDGYVYVVMPMAKDMGKA